MTGEDRLALLGIAREALTAHVCGWPTPRLDLTGALAEPAGAFVTLHRHGELRGCIGHLDPAGPVGRVVARCAIAAGTHDPRFGAVAPAELDELDIEVSVLGPLERTTAAAIEVGRHGLVVEKGDRRGLLLPQVAVEFGWDTETFLAETARKAGLPHDGWKHGATIWRFEAEVFGEGKEGR